MEIEQKIVNITEIKENKDNPRKISKSQLERLKLSLQKFPEMLSIREIVVDENMTILGGNMRYRALKELGEKTIPIRIVKGLTDLQKKEFIIKDNNAYGEWDEDILQTWDIELLNEWDLKIEKDEFQEAEKFDNYNCKYPIIPEYGEKYNAVIIVCDNEIDYKYIIENLGINKAKSYKNGKIISDNSVISSKDFVEIIEKIKKNG